MLNIQALEAARAFEEGVIGDAGDGDVGAVLGIGFPAYTGGPVLADRHAWDGGLCPGVRHFGKFVWRALPSQRLAAGACGARRPILPGRSMNFDFSAEQQALRDQVGRLFAEGRARARRLVDSDTPYDTELWRQAIALGLHSGGHTRSAGRYRSRRG